MDTVLSLDITIGQKLRCVEQVSMTDNGSVSVRELAIYNSSMSESEAEQMLSELEADGYVTEVTSLTTLDELPDTYYVFTQEGRSFLEEHDMWEEVPNVRYTYYEGLGKVPEDFQTIREHSNQKPSSDFN